MRKKILFFISFLAVIFVTAFSACKKSEPVEPTHIDLTETSSFFYETQNDTTDYSTSSDVQNTETASAPLYSETEQTQQNEHPVQTGQTTQNENTSVTEVETENEAEEPSSNEESTTSKYTRTGESVFTDDKNNKYLSAVAKKYNLDADTLVAIYTIPDANGNIVLEFDGSKDENGKPVRNEKTLVAIYSIDKEFNSKRASEDSSLNEYSDIEMKTMFFTVNKYLIPKFENELNG